MRHNKAIYSNPIFTSSNFIATHKHTHTPYVWFYYTAQKKIKANVQNPNAPNIQPMNIIKKLGRNVFKYVDGSYRENSKNIILNKMGWFFFFFDKILNHFNWRWPT